MLRRSSPNFAKVLAHLFPGKQFATNPLLQFAAENAFSLKTFCDAKGHELVVSTNVTEFDAHLPNSDFVITTSSFPVAINKERLSKAKNLQVLCTAGVGSEHVDIPSATSQGVTVLELTGTNVSSYANHIIMMTLSALRDAPANGPVVAAAVKAGGEFDLARATTRSMDLTHRSIGVLGSGRVGYRVLLRLAAFDCTLHYHDLHRLRRELEVHVGVTHHRTPEALAAESDILITTVPVTRWTQGLVGKSLLDAIRPGCLIVNASGHGVIDVAALSDALGSGKVSGYATDCWPEGRADATLAALPNTFLWPPTGGLTLDAQAEIARALLDVLERFHGQRNYPAEYVLAHNGIIVSKSLNAPA